MTARPDAMQVLEQTSRTFYAPIVQLPDGLREAVASAYLCLRAIDEVEDHPNLDRAIKIALLQRISLSLQAQHSLDRFDHASLAAAFAPYRDILPEVTLRIGEWACY